jgi:hypothetical protein
MHTTGKCPGAFLQAAAHDAAISTIPLKEATSTKDRSRTPDSKSVSGTPSCLASYNKLMTRREASR